jgi:4-amino-4-deoxy-L-arabinose transferase-like glycosyltransferase
MYLLARRILGGRFGAYAAMLYAFSPMLFVYSLEVRMYMLLILVFIFLLIAHWAVAVEHREEKWIVVAYSVLAAALFYIHYIAIFILLGLLIHWATTSKLSRARVLRLSATVMLTLLFISPGIPILLEQHAGKSEQTLALEHSLHDPNALSFGDGQRNIAEPTGAKVLAKSAAAMAGFFPAASPVLLLLCAIPLMVALLGAVFLGIVKGDPLCRLFLLMSLAVGSGVIALHLSSTRYLLPLIPLLVLAMARVVQYGAGRSRWLLPSIAVGSLIFCVYAAGFIRQETVRHGSPWQNLVGVVEQNYQSGDLVVFDALYSQVPFDYFAQQAQFHPRETGFPISIYSWWDEQKFKGWGGPVISRSDLDRFTNKLARPTTVWLVSFETYYYDPHNELQARLRELGQVTEFHIPAEGNGDTQDDSALRLMRVTIR